MGEAELLIALLAGVVVLSELASLLRIPYHIVLVIAGLAIGLAPGLMEVELDPDLILLAFVPPLLQAASFEASPHALREHVQPILSLAIGLVVLTVFAIALVAHLVIGIPWAAAVVLGAIVAPTDPVAAEAIFRRIGAPHSLRTVIAGESLVNDAIAIVVYQLAVAVAIGETVSTGDAAGRFVVVGLGGAALGLALGRLALAVWRRLREHAALIVATAITPYLVFIAAEELHLSGILAVVASGLYLGWHSPELATADARLSLRSFWEVFQFLLNALLFVLLGLAISGVVDGLGPRSAAEIVAYSALTVVTVVTVRVLYFNTVPYLRVRVSGWLGVEQPLPSWRDRLVASWSGPRGAVALALALAVPLQAHGGPFPERDLIILLAYAVILATIVGQGLTLEPLIKRLGVTAGEEERGEEIEARIATAQAALGRFSQVCDRQDVPLDSQIRIREIYERRIERLTQQLGTGELEPAELERSEAWRRWRRDLLDAERERLREMRRQGEVRQEVARRIERDLDLEEARWA